MTHYPFKGQRILITGATTGIGRACALKLAAEGAQVWINHHAQGQQAAELVDHICTSGGLAHAVEADVTQPEAVSAMFAKVCAEGPLHGLVNNAGIILEKPFLDTGEQDWQRVMSVDLDAVYRCCRHALAGMQTAKAGSIVNVSSDLGFLGREHYVAYCTAKAGVIGLTRSLAREFAPHIRINAVAPGPIETPMLTGENMSAEWLAKELAIPAERFGKPEEVAAAVAFLLSSAASFFTGQILGPNGGSWMGG
ncbi:SDR family NAD(P)-dependent oxidoreductase [Halopseudomonas salina]|uniref:Beta-ketoacyl-ACP reductase n=1 Tax=Halopseudomonas salina TaxID=1323744 RepID=A0ABQ1PBH9_9GAMM|nr:3-oxoacyl-ACP reductase family protein [Halopseudomonas salina]GGC92991.1 beta-ketoacyl-ACP reductase [Halopseudomonas salina]